MNYEDITKLSLDFFEKEFDELWDILTRPIYDGVFVNIVYNQSTIILFLPADTYYSFRLFSPFSYLAPSCFKTTKTVFIKIRISSHKLQSAIYFVSNLTISSKSVISLRPLTCQ